MIFSFYDPASGIFTGTVFSGPADSVDLNCPLGFAYLQGKHDHLSVRIDLDTGALVPYTPPPPPPPTTEQIRAELTQAVQDHLDATARAHGYDSMLSLCTYATSSVPRFHDEGQAGVYWRDSVWTYCFGQLQAVLSGQRSAPTAQKLISELPSITWPA